jgi:signal transduction histidine kinase
MAAVSRASGRIGESEIRFGRGAITMFAFLAVCGLITILGTQEVADSVGVLGVFVGSIITGLLFLRNSRFLGGKERLAWSLIGIGVLAASAGVLAVASVFAIVGDAPAFGWTDLFFFAAYSLMLSGFLTLPHTQGSPFARSRMALDGLIGAVSIGALLWAFVLSDIMRDLEGLSVSTRTIGAMYPFLDLVVFSAAVLVLLRRSTHRFDTRLALFTVGVTAQVFGDVMFLASARGGSFEEAQPLFVANLVAVAAFFATAYLLKTSPVSREYADRNPPLWTVVAPYLPALGMLAVFVFTTYENAAQSVNGVLLAATVLVGLLVITRQGVAIVENRAHIEQQRHALVSTISHELRTPLTAILGFIEIIESDHHSLEAREQTAMLEIVHDQADYMSRIVSDLIMLARDVGSEMQLQVEPVAIKEVVSQSIKASGVATQAVTVECPPNLVGVIDPARVQQVLVNMLTNAVRYGGGDILIRVKVVGSDLILEVHDDGDGVPRRFEVVVWDRFERGPNRLNASIPGSGIGLAIVQAIAKAHGGSAAYRVSEELGGACFAISLPGRAMTTDEASRDAGRLRESHPPQLRQEDLRRSGLSEGQGATPR